MMKAYVLQTGWSDNEKYILVKIIYILRNVSYKS